MADVSKEDLKKYELLLIFTPEMPASTFEKEINDLKNFLKEHEGVLFFEDVWGLRKFAYYVKKFAEGYYAILYFHAGPEMVTELKTNVRLNTRVLRHLLVTLPDNFEAKKFTEEELTAVSTERRMPKKMIRQKKPYDVAPPPKAIIEKEAVPGESLLKGKTEEERLKAVEKTLESILENPDIELK